MEVKTEETPKKINVIEYKGHLFKTQEEYAEFKRQELIVKLNHISGHEINTIEFLETLSANAISTKAKLDQLILDVRKNINVEDDEADFAKTPGVNCNEEPEDVEDSAQEEETY